MVQRTDSSERGSKTLLDLFCLEIFLDDKTKKICSSNTPQ